MIRAWNFTKWIFRQFGLLDYVWFAAAFFIGAGIATDSVDQRTLMFKIAGVLFLLWFAKWALWDMSKTVWARFEREEGEVFDILKDKNIK